MSEDSDREYDIRTAFDAGDHGRVATLIITRYGAEIRSFLIARLRSATDGDEAFSMFVEDLWAGISGFGWRCSARGWAYALARNAANRLVSAPQRQRMRNLSLPEDADLSALIEHARSTTQLHLRSDAKARIRGIRDRLEADDQLLLILRVDKGMAFRELALIMHDGELSAAHLDEECVRLRKRFERVKNQIRKLARAEGLLGVKDPSATDTQ